MKTAAKVEHKTAEWVKVSQLLFDTQNHRLPKLERAPTQESLLRIMDRTFNPEVIGRSIADNGYFAEDPMVVIPADHDRYTVVEGNRRLAALKLLLEPDMRVFSRNPELWNDLAERLKKNGFDISEVPVVKHKNRDELRTFLGFRHIAGILKWDPLSKARFINFLIEQSGPDAEFADVARETGAGPNTIRDYYVAYRIYLQAKGDLEIDTNEFEKNFSIMIRALSDKRINDFIRVDKKKNPFQLRKPIRSASSGSLAELIVFIYGTPDEEPVLTDSRQLVKLGAVLANPVALDSLRTNRNLDLAYALTGGQTKSLLENLSKAAYHLQEALRFVHLFKKDPKAIEAVRSCAKDMWAILSNYPQVKSEVIREV